MGRPIQKETSVSLRLDMNTMGRGPFTVYMGGWYSLVFKLIFKEIFFTYNLKMKFEIYSALPESIFLLKSFLLKSSLIHLFSFTAEDLIYSSPRTPTHRTTHTMIRSTEHLTYNNSARRTNTASSYLFCGEKTKANETKHYEEQ